MATREQRLARAREIVAVHEIAGLDYMIDDPLHPDEDTPVERYVLITCTDHSADAGDAWLEFVADTDELLRQIAHLMRDEWGLDGVWDLDADDYLTPLPVRVTIGIGADDVTGESRTLAITI